MHISKFVVSDFSWTFTPTPVTFSRMFALVTPKQITIGYFFSASSLNYVKWRLQAQVQRRFVSLVSHFKQIQDSKSCQIG